MRFLIIEDNPGDTAILQKELERAFDVLDVEACETVAGSRTFRETPLDCIFADLGLPDAMGIQVVEVMKELFPDTPLIVLTGDSDQETATKALERGAHDYLTKDDLSTRSIAKSVRYAMARRGYEREVEASEAQLSHLMQSAPVGIAQVDDVDRITYANPALGSMVGLSRAVNGSAWTELFEDSDLPRLRRLQELADAEGNAVGHAVRLPRADADRWVELSISATGGDGTVPRGYLMVFHDRTEEILAEVELARLREMFSKVDDLVLVFDNALTVLSANPAAAARFGLMPGDRVGDGTADPNTSPFPSEILDELTGSGSFRGEAVIPTRDGPVGQHVVTARRETDPATGEVFYWLLAHDISKEIESAALREVVSQKDRFIASVSHELRTPLTAVIGFTRAVVDERVEGDERDELLGVALQQAEELGSLVEDLIVGARVDIGEITVIAEEIDLGALIDGIWRALGPPTSSFSNRVTGITARADPIRVRQITRNLLVNALRYGGQSIWVEAEQAGSDVTVFFCDDGDGVSDPVTRSVFDAYVTTGGEASQPDALGLGLSVSRQLARLMDGDLYYDGSNGTRFCLRLPLWEFD